MREIIDLIYSSEILRWGFTVVVCGIFALIIAKNPFENRIFYNAFNISLAAIMVGLISLSFFYYPGYAMFYDKMLVDRSCVFLFEESNFYNEAKDGTTSGTVGRLHILDKNSGKLKTRLRTGQYSKMVASRNDTICYINHNEIYLYDALAMKEICHITSGDWSTISPELQSGVEKISVGCSNDAGPAYICIDAKTGKKFTFEPFSRRLSDEVPKTNHETLLNEKNLLTLENTNGKLFRFVPEKGFENLFHVSGSDAYLEPELLCADPVKKVFMFAYYATTDKEELVFEARDFDYKLLWKKTATALGVNENLLRKIDVELTTRQRGRIDLHEYKDGILYFNYGGYMLAFDPLSEMPKWISRS